METIGISPKAIAAGITGYLAPIVVGWLATKVGVDIDVNTATALLGPLVLAAVTFGAAYAAKAGIVFEEDNIEVVEDPDVGVHTPKPPLEAA